MNPEALTANLHEASASLGAGGANLAVDGTSHRALTANLHVVAATLGSGSANVRFAGTSRRALTANLHVVAATLGSYGANLRVVGTSLRGGGANLRVADASSGDFVATFLVDGAGVGDGGVGHGAAGEGVERSTMRRVNVVWRMQAPGNMRILYGVTGEGLGHAMRSVVVIDALRRRGHRVKIAASGRAAALLAKRFDDVLSIRGLFIVYRDGSVQRRRTIVENLRGAPALVRQNVGLYEDDVRSFDPDLCISDFDSFAHLYGKTHGRPVVALDHQHVLDRCAHPRTVRSSLSPGFGAARAFVRAKMPGCERYFVPTFFFPPVRRHLRPRTTLVAPILRDVVSRATPTLGDEVLVYQTSPNHESLIAALGELARSRFVVYGMGERPSTRNVRFRPFDEAAFVADLASSRAVIANGGFTTVSEALYLGKPVLSIPVQGQHEQELNASYLTELGVGARVDRADAPTIARFLDRLETHRAALAKPPALRGARALDHLCDALTSSTPA